MQALYIALCLCVLGTSSALKCGGNCESAPCTKEMSQRSLTCDAGTQQRDSCDHHDHFHGQDVSKLTDEVVKQRCCPVTCYSMFSDNKFTCPAGYASPEEDDRRETSADKSSDELQKQCCRVSCYTLFKANKFTCPADYLKPTPKWKNDDIHDDISSKTAEQLRDRCCSKESLCYSKLTAKSLTCDGFGRMPVSQEDTSLDSKLTSEADSDDVKLQQQCCTPNCFARITQSNFSCPSDTVLRGIHDHTHVTDLSEAGLKKACCVKNCYSRMTAANLKCAQGKAMKSKTDMHDPGEVSTDELKKQCCQEFHCPNNFCYAAMSEKGIWGQCPEYSMPLSMCDGHWAWSHEIPDNERMTFIKAKSADEVKKGCCRKRCYGTMKSRKLKCPAGYAGRTEHDGHNPFGNDWDAKTDKELTDECCQKQNQCSLILRKKGLDCNAYGGRVPGETEHNKMDVDPSKLSTDNEIEEACCIKTCAFGMHKKNLKCDSYKSETIQCHSTPFTSFEQPEADIKWACCSAGPDRPQFKGCKALIGDTCDGDTRVRDDHENPFYNRDFSKMDKAKQKNYCCKTSCYNEVKTRKLTCPVATQMFDKNDFHNPFNWNEELRDKSDAEIQSKCCRPLNKCRIKLDEMNLSCDGFGSHPGETENLKYAFDPLALKNADDIKSKCCKPNCYYTLKKRNLVCKKGISRSQHDGHQPFADFSKETDESILGGCCSENCFSHFADNKLTCDQGQSVRSKEDFHHFDKSLDATGLKQQCCRTKCREQLASRKISCDDGYITKDDERPNTDWIRMSDNDVKNTCCKELPSECKTEHTPYGNWGKRAEVFNDVTYLDNWGKSIVNSKSNAYRNYFTSCKINNKKYNSKQECDAADGDCCFFCEDFECSPNYPSASTCKDNKPSDFMKKHGSDGCSTDGRLDLEMINECGICPQAQDLFKEYDDGTMSSGTFSKKGSAIERVRSAFHGGVNLQNVLSEVHINDKNCPKATAGLLITPRNSGVFTGSGKSGTLLAVLDVVNHKSEDPTRGVKLGGEADYLLVGGSNEGDVDITTTGYVSVVGLNNKGAVNAKGADNLVIGNTINSGKVVLAAKTGKIINVANAAGAEVVIESGTWHFDGPTRNDGIVRVKSGKFTGNVKENAGKIIIDSGVTGKVVFCKDGPGELKNDGQVEISYESGAAFCKKEVVSVTTPPPPAYFYCRNAAKHVERAFDKESTCAQTAEHIKTYWEAVKYELNTADAKKFFSTCCDPETAPPKGKKYTLQQKKIKKKIVRASTIVNIDFTDDKNKDARGKFEKVFIKKAKAKSGKFEYKLAQSKGRRLAQGTAVSAVLEYDDDAGAQEGQKAVSASTFATQVSEDLKKESVEVALTSTSAGVEEIEDTVVEEVLVDDPKSDDTKSDGTKSDGTKSDGTKSDGTKSDDGKKDPPTLGDAPYKPTVSFAIVLAAIIALC